MATTAKIDVNNSTYTAITTAGQKIVLGLDGSIGGGKIVIATALPAANTEDYFSIRNSELPLTIDQVGGTDIIYFKSDRPTGVLRVIKY